MRELNVRSKADWNQLCSVTYHIKRRVPLSRRQTNREQYKQTRFFAPVTKNERKFIFGMQGGGGLTYALLLPVEHIATKHLTLSSSVLFYRLRLSLHVSEASVHTSCSIS